MRLAKYNHGQNVPQWVAKAIRDGYTITRKGLLCSADIPSMKLVPITRLIFVTLEGTFAFIFRALRTSMTDPIMGTIDVCQWAPDTLDFDGLRSHSPFIESVVGDFFFR